MTVNEHKFVICSVWSVLAQLGLARATQSRKAYDDFLALWKDADEELPLLITARKEAEQK